MKFMHRVLLLSVCLLLTLCWTTAVYGEGSSQTGINVDMELVTDLHLQPNGPDYGSIEETAEDAVQRPDNLVVSYEPHQDAQIQTFWIDRESPPPFSNLYLIQYDTLYQETSPYDPESIEMDVEWDEQSYLDGLASHADSFEITGTFHPHFDDDSGYLQQLYQKGLIRIKGRPRAVVRVRNPEEQIYCNPYSDRFGYTWDYQFQVYIRPDTSLSEIKFPAASYLEPNNGDIEMIREFGLEWNYGEYEAGIASGKDSFTVSGKYVLNPKWSIEDQKHWENGKIRIEDDTPQPELTVHILREELPFTVKMQSWVDTLIPTFTFPWPNGAEKVTWAFSFDKEIWYEEDVQWDSEWEWKEVYQVAAVYDENDEIIGIPKEHPFPIYCKLTVTGSNFEGETGIKKISPDKDGNWQMDDDQGGDHGGGGQGEHNRPGKEEPGTPARADAEAKLPETVLSSEPSVEPPADPQSSPEKPEKTETPTKPSESPNTAAPSLTEAPAEQVLVPQTIPQESDLADDNGAAPVSPPEERQRPTRLWRYAAAAAATVVLAVLGGVIVRTARRKKK